MENKRFIHSSDEQVLILTTPATSGDKNNKYPFLSAPKSTGGKHHKKLATN